MDFLCVSRSLELIKTIVTPANIHSASLHPEKDFIVAGGDDFKLYKYDYATPGGLGGFMTLGGPPPPTQGDGRRFLFMLHVCLSRPQSRIRATLGRSTASVSAPTGSCTPAALRTAPCGCGRRPWARPMACGSVSCQVTSLARKQSVTSPWHLAFNIRSASFIHSIKFCLSSRFSLKGLNRPYIYDTLLTQALNLALNSSP